MHQLQELCRVSLDATCISSLYAKVDVAGGISEAFITLENVCICKYSDRVDLYEIPGQLPRCEAITSRVVVPVLLLQCHCACVYLSFSLEQWTCCDCIAHHCNTDTCLYRKAQGQPG